jgi:hypothetical protein
MPHFKNGELFKNYDQDVSVQSDYFYDKVCLMLDIDLKEYFASVFCVLHFAYFEINFFFQNSINISSTNCAFSIEVSK